MKCYIRPIRIRIVTPDSIRTQTADSQVPSSWLCRTQRIATRSLCSRYKITNTLFLGFQRRGGLEVLWDGELEDLGLPDTKPCNVNLLAGIAQQQPELSTSLCRPRLFIARRSGVVAFVCMATVPLNHDVFHSRVRLNWNDVYVIWPSYNKSRSKVNSSEKYTGMRQNDRQDELQTRAFQFGQKSFNSIRFSLPNRFFWFDSIRQFDKFAAFTLTFK